jgi:predicted ester cyclase
MTSKVDLYKEYFDAAWANPPSSIVEAGKAYIADDFQSLDKDGNLDQNREAWISVGQLMAAAFTDFKFVYSDMHEEDDGVIVIGQFEGIHTGDLDLSALGLGVIPASGKKIVVPSGNKFMIENDKIVSRQDYGDYGGSAAFLAALGVTPPSA